jgi:ATP-dependent RNA helicase DDX23/PRP28
MAPARELASQITTETNKLCVNTDYKSLCVVGGDDINEQALHLRQGVHILIGTPGRINDCLQRRYVVLTQCNYIVLDEADRMIDLNFEPQIVSILDEMPLTNTTSSTSSSSSSSAGKVKDAGIYRQTIMFSATMPAPVARLARKYLREPVFVSIGDSTGSINENVTQTVVWTVNEGQKRRALTSLLTNCRPPAIVFCNSHKTCDDVALLCETKRFKTAVLHGGKSQEARQKAIKAFREGTVDILVATDVAGRGIDVKGITLVVNYDMSQALDAYKHRIGRTGRAGAKGTAVTLVSPKDEDVLLDLRAYLKEARQRVPMELERFKPSGKGKYGGSHNNNNNNRDEWLD